MGLDLTPQQAPPQRISLDDPNAGLPQSPEQAGENTRKVMIGTPTANFDDVYSQFLMGKEKELRAHIAVQTDIARNAAVEDKLREMAQKRPLLPADIEYVRSIASKGPSDPTSVIEENYAKSLMQQVSDQTKSTYFREVQAMMPKATKEILDVGESALTYREYARAAADRMQGQVSQQSWFGWGIDQAKLLSQIYTELKLRGNVPGTGFTEGGFLGANLQEQAKALYRLPFNEFKATFDGILDRLAKDNPSAAKQFADAVVGATSNERLWTDIMTPLMLSGLAVGTKNVVKMASTGVKEAVATKHFSDAVKNVVKETTDKPAAKEVIAEAAGDLQEAAVHQTNLETVRVLRGGASAEENVKQGLSNVFKPVTDATVENKAGLRQELVNRLVEAGKWAQTNLLDILGNIAQVERIPGLMQSEAAIRVLETNIKNKFPGVDNTIIGIEDLAYNPISKTYSVNIKFGKNDATLFSSPMNAQKFANQTGFKGAIVEQKGMGFYLSVPHTLKETDDIMRDTFLKTAETKTPESIASAYGGWLGSLRTPEDTLSYMQRMQRKVATYAPSVLAKYMQEVTKDIDTLKKWSFIPGSKHKRWNDWKKVVDQSIHSKHPVTGADGYLWESPQEFMENFMNINKYSPDEQQIAAWFAYKRGKELTEFLLKREKFASIAREGGKSHYVWAIDPTKETAKTVGSSGVHVVGERLTGKFPPINDSVVIMGDKVGTEEVRNDTWFRTAAGKRIADKVEKGELSIIRIINPEEQPFKGFGLVGDDVFPRYVITKNVDSKELSFADVKINKTPDYDFSHYIAQPRIQRDAVSKHYWYRGDTHVMGVNIHAMGADIVRGLNEVRLAIKANNFAKAAAANPLPDWDMVRGWFSHTDPVTGQTRTPLLSLDHEIRLTSRNKTIYDTHPALKDEINNLAAFENGAFRDGTREGYGRFLTGRNNTYDLFTVKDTGSKGNPLYKVEPAEFASPIQHLNRGIKRAIEASFMNDYKTFSVEHWIREAVDSGVLGVTPEEAWDAPYYHFYNPTFAKGADQIKVNNLKTAQFQIQQFMGVQDEMTTFLHSWTQRMVDNLYGKGQTKAALALSHTLPSLRDPFTFIRAATFHFKIGLFAIPQLLVQAQTFTSIMGIAGHTYAVPGAKAAMLHYLSRINKSPEILEHLDKMASGTHLIPGTSRWKPGEWKEARQLISRTGFDNVAGEYIARDNPMSYEFIPGTGTKFLDASSFFFREGEKSIRYAAYYTAYREFRDKNPLVKIGLRERREILERADLLSVNMSRASASALHKGILSIPAQFLSYQLRMMELFTSKRISHTDRARLLAWNAAMYGVPVSLSVTGLPAADWMQKKAREHGYVVGDNWATSTFMEGIPALLGALATGGGDPRKGNWYNIGDAYGPQGLFGDALKSDTPVLEAMTGAAGTTIVNSIANTYPFWASLMSMVKDDDQHFPLKSEDWADMFSEVSSASRTKQAYMAIKYGQWLSRKEANLGPITPSNAIFQYLTGLQSQGLQDVDAMSWTRRTEKEMQDEGMKKAIKEFRRAVRTQDDPMQFRDYMTRVYRYMEGYGIPREDWGKIFSIAGKGYEPLIDQISRKYYTDGVPAYRKPTALEQYQRALRLKQERQDNQ